MTYELELPGILVDELTEDQPVATHTPTIFNRNPEPTETGVPIAAPIQFDLAIAHDTALIDLTTVVVTVNGSPAYDGATTGFQTGFVTGSSVVDAPITGVKRFVIQPLVPFASSAAIVVAVAASSTVGSTPPLAASYTFYAADVDAPAVVSAVAIDLTHVRVVFGEPVEQGDGTGDTDALNPANWTLVRYGDYVTPVVAASVVAVEEYGGLDGVTLETDIPLTPGGNYRVVCDNVVDTSGNAAEDPTNFQDFTGWVPPRPDERDFDLYKMLPLINRQEDETTLDLKRFVGCIQEVVDLQLFDIDSFLDILDPDLADEMYVDLMLRDLGNPFAFDLSATDKQRLVHVLVDMYRLKGTAVGIAQVVLFFLGLVVTIDAYNIDPDGLVLGESELGVDWTLAPGTSYQRFSFEVLTVVALSSTQRTQLSAIVNYMKPAHTHFVALVEPTIPVTIDHLELGMSELGEDEWELH